MSFIKRITGPDERLIGICSAHWIYGVKGLFWLVAFVALGAGVKYGLDYDTVALISPDTLPMFDVIGHYTFITCTVIGSLLFLFHFLILISLEIGLTTRRVIFKRGLVMVDVREVDLEEIKAANVNNGWLGRFFNYGYLILDARFITNLELPAIGDPYRFIKALNECRAQIRTDSMRVILEGPKPAVQVAAQATAQHHVDDTGNASLNQPAPPLHSHRYDALTDNPGHEIYTAVREISDMDRSGAQAEFQQDRPKKTRNHKLLRPAAQERMNERRKFRERFHSIACYGNVYHDPPPSGG